MSRSVEYEAQVQRRAGEDVMVVRRTVTTAPESRRGTEWNKQTREHSVQVIPLDEVQKLMTALIEGFSYPVSDELNGHDSVMKSADMGDEPQFVLLDTSGIRIAGEEPMRFWTFYEADAHVTEMRKEGRITKGWTVWRASELAGEDGRLLDAVEAISRGGLPLETYGA